jgi:RNase P subunit RPR2
MNCWYCNAKLIQGSHKDCKEDEEHSMVTNLSCPECEAFVLVYWGKRKKEDMDDETL